MIRLNVELIQKQIDTLRQRQQDRVDPAGTLLEKARAVFTGDVPYEHYALAGLAGLKPTRRPVKWDRWQSRRTKVVQHTRDAKGQPAQYTIAAHYPNYLTFFDDRYCNRLCRRANRAPQGRKRQRQYHKNHGGSVRMTREFDAK